MSDSYCSSPLSVRCVEVIVVGCERGTGDLRESVTQVYWKDGTLLAEHDWLHDDPIYANCFLRSAAERGEWLPVKLRAQADAQPADPQVSADEAAQGQAPVFAGADVQRDRIGVRNSHPVEAATKLEMTLTKHGWHVVASHPWGQAFLAICDDDKVTKHISDWLAELRIEAALGRNETMEQWQARRSGMAADRLSSYSSVGWRNVTPVCPETRQIGVGFDASTGPVRLALSLEHAAELATCLDGYIKAFAGNQSCGSELMPSAPKSVPSEGVKT